MSNSGARERKFAVALAKADTEQEVINILQEEGYWDGTSAWREYGDNPINSSTIGGQQSRADNALVEKLVNSVDAVLMRECLERGIRTDSDKAPQSIAEAQERFFRIYNGRLSSIDDRDRTRLAENIMLAATGSKRKPSYTIIDRGEGQSPKRMPKTILSLTESNKIKIPFVQGQFGMGGSGVLRFCSSKHRLLLVISRRNRKIDENTDREMFGEDDTRDLWGVTVVRRERPKSGEKISHYMYLAPGGNVLSFDADELPLIPGPHPAQYGRPLDSGTFIKLYEYNVGPLKTLISFDLYNRLSLLMPGIGLPVRFMERRSYQGGSFDTTFSGLSVRLDNDKYENLEPEFDPPSTGNITVEEQRLSYSIYVFKKGRKENYAGGEGIAFLVNGQAHGFLSKEFFSRGSVDMSYLSDSILVMVDCSKMSSLKREDLFMTSRDRLAMTSVRRSIEEKLAEIIKNHPGLKNLKNRRRDEIIKDKLQDSKPMVDLLSEVIKKSQTLSAFLNLGSRVSNPFDITPASPISKEFKGEKFPSRFKLVKKPTKDKPKRCPINHMFRVQYETDAENNYFARASEPGELQLKVDGETMQDYALNLWNGLATLTINIPGNRKIGETLRFSTTVNDVNQVQPFTEEFYVLIEGEKGTRSGGKGKRKEPAGDEEGKGRHKKSSLGMPRIFDIKREDWGKDKYKEFHFNKYSALKVKNAGENQGYDFFINMDNLYLRNEIKRNIQIASKILEMRYSCGMVLLGLSVLNFDENRKKKQSKEDNEANDANGNELPVDERISQLTEAISPTLLPMISHLGSADFEG